MATWGPAKGPARALGGTLQLASKVHGEGEHTRLENPSTRTCGLTQAQGLAPELLRSEHAPQSLPARLLATDRRRAAAAPPPSHTCFPAGGACPCPSQHMPN